MRKYDHITPIINELKWLKIDQKCKYDTCIAIFKILRSRFPSWLITLRTVRQIHNIHTRQRSHLFFSRTNTDVGSRSLAKRGPLLWNNIPQQIQNIESLHTFKAHLKKLFLEEH